MTQRAAVLGHPIGHSLSPVLHRAAYAALGLDWSYDAVDVTEDEVGDFLTASSEVDEWVGFSVTAPLKTAVIPSLATVSDLATRVGAVNTIVHRDGGAMDGHNTDVAGIVRALAEVGAAQPGTALGIVGSGGTAAAALAAAAEMSAQPIAVTARRPEAAAALIERVQVPATVVPLDRVGEVLTLPRVIVTLPGDAAASLATAVPEHPGVLLDVTYHPWPTTLAAAWLERGGVVVPGHRMLLWQAVEQVRLMTGLTPPVAAMESALTAALEERTGPAPGG